VHCTHGTAKSFCSSISCLVSEMSTLEILLYLRLIEHGTHCSNVDLQICAFETACLKHALHARLPDRARAKVASVCKGGCLAVFADQVQRLLLAP